MRTPQGEILLVEVKSVTSMEYLHIRLKDSQKRRLKRTLLFCLEKYGNTRLALAIVSQQGEVQVFEDFLA